MSSLDLFKTTLMILLFWSFSTTLIAHMTPADALPYITGFTEINNEITLDGVATEVQGSLSSQTNIPVLDLGALVFYSGNILIDLILNFVFGIPEMFLGLINGLLFIFNIDGFIATQIQIFSGVIFTVMYFVGVISLMTGIRTGRLLE